MMTFRKELDLLEEKGLRRSLRLLESESSTWSVIDRKRVLNLCSNNYLGLANDDRLKQAAIDAIEQYGFGAGASRLVCGNMTLHKELEEDLAAFKGTESALIFNSGYTANIGIIGSLVGRGDIVFCDKLNHASIIDGVILSRAELKRYAHRNVVSLEKSLEKTKGSQKKLIVTDSVFSMDGDIAPIKELIDLAKKYKALLMIDDAHATGVLGQEGKGVLEHLGLEDHKHDIVQMGTLSKAFGGFGAYACGSKDLIDYLIQRSRPFIYTTALPVSVAAADKKAIEIVKYEPELRTRLNINISFMRSRLMDLGFTVLGDKTPIIPLILNDTDIVMKFSRMLFDEGVFVQGIRPPTVPKGSSRLRITVMATHTQDDLGLALDKISKIAKILCII